MVSMVIGQTMSAQVADAGPDTSLCVTSYTMQGSPVPLGGTGQWVLYTGCATFMDPTSPTTLITNLCIGSNVAGWVVTEAGGSPITSDIVEITVYDPNMPIANAGMDQTIVGPQSSAQLSGSPTPSWPATCWWDWVQGNGVVVDPNDPNSLVTGLIIGDNMLTWTCDNGPCWSSLTVDTVVIQMMQLPTGMTSPVGNDTPWFAYDAASHALRITTAAPVKQLRMLDAHGRTVLSGTLNVGTLPDGLYIVRAEVGGEWRTQRLVVVR